MSKFFDKIGDLISTLPQAAARVYKVGFNTIFSLIPGVGSSVKTKATTPSTTSVDPVSLSSTDLFSYLLTPPANLTNNVVNAALINWLKKNFLLIVAFIVAIFIIIKNFRKKRRR